MDTKILLSALQEVEKRAERVSEDDVLATYVNVESLTAALGARTTASSSAAGAPARPTR